MAKLYWHYSAMNAGKSNLLLTAAHNYIERDMKVYLMKPAIDTRTKNTIKSRIGTEKECRLLTKYDDPYSIIFTSILTGNKPDCVFVDEAQFLTKEQVMSMCRIVDILDIPVMTYGLRTDFQGNFFEGSKWLSAWADKIRELRGICHCGSKATFVARLDSDGNAIREGEQVVIGGEETYVSLCRKHYFEKTLVYPERKV